MPPITQTPAPSPAAQLQLQTLAPPVTAVPSRRRNRVPLLMRPFAAVTEQFDDAFAVLGPIGRLVSSSFFRALMGLSGLIMLVGSGAWFAIVWFGWSR
jgi:hypothetical protein